MNEMQWRVQDAQIHPNRLIRQKSESSASEGLTLAQDKDNPMVADILDIKEMMGNPDISLKAQGIESYIQSIISKERVGQEKIIYMNTLNELAQKMNIPFQQLMESKQGLKILDLLFREVALLNNESSKGYFNRMKAHLKEQKIQSSLQKLSLALAKL